MFNFQMFTALSARLNVGERNHYQSNSHIILTQYVDKEALRTNTLRLGMVVMRLARFNVYFVLCLIVFFLLTAIFDIVPVRRQLLFDL